MMVHERTEWQKFVDAKLSDHDKRLTEQEKANAVYQVLQEEQRKYLNDRFNRTQDNINSTKKDLTDQITSIRSGINKMLWIVGGAVVLAVIQWILSGGLTVIAR